MDPSALAALFFVIDTALRTGWDTTDEPITLPIAVESLPKEGWGEQLTRELN